MNTKKSPAARIWYVIYPFLYYYAVMLIVMTIAQWVFGADNEHFVMCQLTSTVITIPFMIPIYRQDRALAGIAPEKLWITKEKLLHSVMVILTVACISIALNNIISMTPLISLSLGYQEANAGFYGSTLAMELISSALFTPILEELVFRGIIFGRLKTVIPKYMAVFVSALVFAAVHYNIVQFIYALLLGIVLALVMEKAGNVYVAVVGHITANFIAVVRTETGILDRTVRGDAFSWIISVGLLLMGLLGMFLYLMKLCKTNCIKCSEK